MTHFQDLRDKWYDTPACGARPLWTGASPPDPNGPRITCRACQRIVQALKDKEPIK